MTVSRFLRSIEAGIGKGLVVIAILLAVPCIVVGLIAVALISHAQE